MLSRRRLITVGAATGAATLLSSAASRANAATADLGDDAKAAKITDFVTLKPSSDTGFVSEVDRLFPGLLSDPVFQQIKSHAVLIANVGKEAVNAYSTHWDITTSTGGYEMLVRHYFHPSAKRPRTIHFGLKGNKTRFTGKIPLLTAGETRLVTPYFNWSPSFYRTHPKPNWSRMLSASSSRQLFATELSSATDIEVSIDALIINNRDVIGLDKANLGRVFRVTRNAEHDEANALLKLVKKGVSRDQIAEFLKNRTSVALPSRTNAFRHLYVAVRRRQAKILFRRFKQGTTDQFLRTLKLIKRQPKTTTGLAHTA
jgi:hypothetical protein